MNNVIHRVTENVVVEVDDLHDKAIKEKPLPEEKPYEKIEFLSNGWIRCMATSEEDDDKRMYDYYPPQRVNGVFLVEDEDSAVSATESKSRE